MNFYKHYIGDFQRDTGHLSLTERGAYLALIHYYYATEKPLPTDLDSLCRIAGAVTKMEQAAVKAVLSFFEIVESGLMHSRIEAELHKAGEISNTNRDIAIAREAKRKAEREARTEHEQSTNRAKSVERTVSRTVSRTEHEQSTLQTPDSRLQNKEQESMSSSSTDAVFEHWKKTFNHPRARLDQKRRKVVSSALKLFPEADVINALTGYRRSKWHMGANDRQKVFDDIELFLRDAKHIEEGLRLFENPNAELEGTKWI